MNKTVRFGVGTAFIMFLASQVQVQATPIVGLGNPLSDPTLTGGTQEGFDTTAPGLYPSITIGLVKYTGVGAPLTIGPDYNGSFNTSGGQSIFNDFDNLPTAFRFDFAMPISAFAFNWGASDSGWVLQAFDSGNNLLDSLMVPPVNGSNSGEYYGLSAPGISYAVITNAGAGDYVFIDRFTTDVPAAVCGDGITTPPEQCDDGNLLNGDCCSSSCQFESAGSSCVDSDPCNGAESCDGAGVCTPGTPLPCDDGNPCTQDACTTGVGCVYDTTPAAGCRAAAKSILLIKNNATDAKDKLNWKWTKGAATALGELGTPTGTTNYTLCVYSGTSAAVVSLPSGASWTALSKGFKYKDLSGAPDGATKAVLKSGAAGKAKALVKGKGVNLPDAPAPAFALPVTVQLVNDANNTCFEAVYTVAKKNTSAQFKAMAP